MNLNYHERLIKRWGFHNLEKRLRECSVIETTGCKKWIDEDGNEIKVLYPNGCYTIDLYNKHNEMFSGIIVSPDEEYTVCQIECSTPFRESITHVMLTY